MLDWEKVESEHPEEFDRISVMLIEFEDAIKAGDNVDREQFLERMVGVFDRDQISAELANIEDTHAKQHIREINGYYVLDEIGKGGFGTVYRAFDRVKKEKAAIKLTHANWEFSQSQSELEKEAKVLENLSHPNIGGYRESGWYKNSWYLATDWVEGRTTQDAIDEHVRFKMVECLDIAIQISDALSYSHENEVIHGDVKPNNIIFSESDGKLHATLIDFGIARSTTSPATERLWGNKEYVAPEQFEGVCDIRCDIYSLGIVLTKLLETNCDQATWNKPLASVIRKATAKKPSDRYQNTYDLCDDLTRVRDQIESGEIRKTRKPMPKIAKPIAAAACLALIAFAGLRLFPSTSADIGDVVVGDKAGDLRIKDPPITPVPIGDELKKNAHESAFVKWDGDTPSFVISEYRNPGAKANFTSTPPWPAFFNAQGNARIKINSNPPGATLSFYEFSFYQEPQVNRCAVQGSTPLVTWLEPGIYFVTAEWPDGSYTEVFRCVPDRRTSEGIARTRRVTFRERTVDGLKLSYISKPPILDSANMESANSVWIDKNLVEVDDILDSRVHLARNPGSYEDGGARIRIQWYEAMDHLETLGKRIPFLHELDGITHQNGLDEWTANIHNLTYQPLKDGTVQQIVFFLARKATGGEEKLPDFAKRKVGVRGVRAVSPFVERVENSVVE